MIRSNYALFSDPKYIGKVGTDNMAHKLGMPFIWLNASYLINGHHSKGICWVMTKSSTKVFITKEIIR